MVGTFVGTSVDGVDVGEGVVGECVGVDVGEGVSHFADDDSVAVHMSKNPSSVNKMAVGNLSP